MKSSSKIYSLIISMCILLNFSFSQKITKLLRSNGINTELYPDASVKLDKQLKYASDKGIPYVAIVGPEEAEKNLVTLKNMLSGTQEQINIQSIVSKIAV